MGAAAAPRWPEDGDSWDHGPCAVSLKASYVFTLTVSVILFLSVLSKPCIPGSTFHYLSLKKGNCRYSFCTRHGPMSVTVFSAEFTLRRAGVLCWARVQGAAGPSRPASEGCVSSSLPAWPAQAECCSSSELASFSAPVWRACLLSSVAGLAQHELPPLPSGPWEPTLLPSSCPRSHLRAQVGPPHSASSLVSQELELGV